MPHKILLLSGLDASTSKITLYFCVVVVLYEVVATHLFSLVEREALRMKFLP